MEPNANRAAMMTTTTTTTTRRARLVRAALAVMALGATAACRDERAERQAEAMTGGDIHRGAHAMTVYGCGSCHQIPGVQGAHGHVGPSLEHVAMRAYLAGQLPNTPENLMHWVRHPQLTRPGTVMPEMGVSAADARDIAAYLYTLR